MKTTVTLPELGAAGPITLSVWYVLPGDLVLQGERLVEVLLEGATFDVSAPVSGWLSEQLALPRDLVRPGQALGTIDAPDAEKLLAGDWS